MSGSALPKAVQKQIATANKILDGLKQPPSDPPKEPAAAPPSDPPKEPAAAPPSDPPKEPAAAPPSDPPKEPTAAPPPSEPKPPEESWQHKYNVLQGKYNAEVPRLKRQLDEQGTANRELRQRINNLETMLASLNAARKPEAPAAPAKSKDVLTPEEIDTYGSDLVEVITRVATAKAEEIAARHSGEVSSKVEEVKRTASQVSQTVAQSAQEKTLGELAKAVPNWEALNQDAGFLNWLDEEDPYTGQQRGVLLRKAFQANKAQNVIAFFRGYLNENAAVTPETSPSTPPAQPKEPQTKMDELVAPGAPKSPTASAPDVAGKRVWTRKEIAELYAKKNAFIIRNPGKPLPEELQKQERDLFKAQSEGRLR